MYCSSYYVQYIYCMYYTFMCTGFMHSRHAGGELWSGPVASGSSVKIRSPAEMGLAATTYLEGAEGGQKIIIGDNNCRNNDDE